MMHWTRFMFHTMTSFPLRPIRARSSRVPRLDNQNHNQGEHNNGECQKGRRGDSTSAGRKLALHDPFLGVEIALVAHEKGCYTDADEGGTEGPTQPAKRTRIQSASRLGVCKRRVEAKKLCYGYANGGKRQRGPQPGEKRSF
jgi:hypothetical protein